MVKKKYLILGALGYNEDLLGGQIVKTRSIYQMFENNLDADCIEYFDTQEIKRSKKKFFPMVRKVLSCDTLIYLPSFGGLKYLFPLVFFLSKIKNISIIYVVVGGWLAEFLRKRPLHALFLRRIKRILVQTSLLKERLEKEYTFQNVEVLHNFRSTNFIPQLRLRNKTLKLIFMARIEKLKGLETIFSFAEYVDINGLDITIDFYGPVSDQDKDYFHTRVCRYGFVTYHGVLEPSIIYETLSKYDILLLPTQYYTEGFPGSILDAYISGIPVIVTKWLYATEFVDDGITGYIVPFDNPQEDFNKEILEIYNDRDRLSELKMNALAKSKEFSEEKAWDIMKKII